MQNCQAAADNQTKSNDFGRLGQESVCCPF